MKEKIINARLYNLVIGLTLLWGFLANFIIIKTINPMTIMNINPFVFIIGYFISCLIGIFMYNSSDNPIISFIGYNFIVVPIGLVLTVCLSDIAPSLIFNAILITGIVVFTMIVLSTIFPQTFLKMGTGLFITLLVVIVVEIILMFCGMHLGIMDWIVAFLFCGYIGFDWIIAQSKEKTIDNAVDSAAAIYVDIINLFIRILDIINN